MNTFCAFYERIVCVVVFFLLSIVTHLRSRPWHIYNITDRGLGHLIINGTLLSEFVHTELSIKNPHWLRSGKRQRTLNTDQ